MIPPAYVAWRAGSSNRVVLPARQAGNRFQGSLKGLQISGYDYLLSYFLYFLFCRCRLCSAREDSERHLLGVGEGGGIAPRVQAIGNHSYHHSATIWREKIRQTQWLPPTFKTCVIFKARWKWPDARRVKLFWFSMKWPFSANYSLIAMFINKLKVYVALIKAHLRKIIFNLCVYRISIWKTPLQELVNKPPAFA